MKDSQPQYVYPCTGAPNEQANKVFKAVAAADDEDGNDDSENNDKYFVISTNHEALRYVLYTIVLLLHPS